MVLKESLALEIIKLDSTKPRSMKTHSLFYWSLEMWSCFLASFHNPDFCLHAVSVTKVSAKVHMAQHCEQEVQQCLPTHQLLNHLCQEALITAVIRNLQHCLSCWAFPAHLTVLKFTMRFRPCEHEVSACLKKISHTLLFFHPNAMYFMNINTKTQQRWKCIYKFAASLEHCPLLIKKLQRGRDKMKRQI